MTYEESYRKCRTLTKLRAEVVQDISIARMINTDRIPIIVTAANKIANEKFKKAKYCEEYDQFEYYLKKVKGE